MSDTGYQPYCEKCGAPVVWCTCLDDIDWSPEMRSYLGRVRLEQQVKELRVELARRDEQRQMDESNYEYEIHRRDKIITRLIALGDALIADEAVFYSQEQAEHYTVVIEEWRALMKELE